MGCRRRRATYLHFHLSCDSWHDDRASIYGFRDGDRHLQMNVMAVPCKILVWKYLPPAVRWCKSSRLYPERRSYPNIHVHISSWATAIACMALTRDTHRIIVINAWGDLNSQRLDLECGAVAPACVTCIGRVCSPARARSAWNLHLHESLTDHFLRERSVPRTVRGERAYSCGKLTTRERA